MRDKRKTATALSQDLDYYIYDMKTDPSLMSFRMSMIDSTEEKQKEMLVNLLTHLNGKAQYFITTHSPTLFGEGWGDKVWYMENITK
ncbi:hypothetical protein [Segatella sp.]|uniref:hypothetical protein n=1 Tax=Segatella sp. TaxID=2974253 RepID=UPI00307A8976